MALIPRIVVDTNVLISALLAGNSVSARAMTKAEDSGQLLASAATLAEIDEVLRRPKFDRFLSMETRREFLKRYRDAIRLVRISTPIQACRDLRDDKFLEVAVYGQADLILSGDADLLALNPFQGVRILTPRQSLELPEQFSSQGDAI
jgi:putative PIN family toxin of toxin-antitoxin system